MTGDTEIEDKDMNDVQTDLGQEMELGQSQSQDGAEKEVMEWRKSRPRSGRPRSDYKGQVMLSEWMVDVPEDLETSWTLVLCPVGKRCLVVTSRGETKAYARNGYLMRTFGSQLPGGNKSKLNHYKEYCVLDCIFSEVEKTFYILDIIAWNGMSFYESETEFRFYWIKTKLEEELPEIGVKTESNPYSFFGTAQVWLRHGYHFLSPRRCSLQTRVGWTPLLP
jgi:snurportin-1